MSISYIAKNRNVDVGKSSATKEEGNREKKTEIDRTDCVYESTEDLYCVERDGEYKKKASMKVKVKLMRYQKFHISPPPKKPAAFIDLPSEGGGAKHLKNPYPNPYPCPSPASAFLSPQHHISSRIEERLPPTNRPPNPSLARSHFGIFARLRRYKFIARSGRDGLFRARVLEIG